MVSNNCSNLFVSSAPRNPFVLLWCKSQRVGKQLTTNHHIRILTNSCSHWIREKWLLFPYKEPFLSTFNSNFNFHFNFSRRKQNKTEKTITIKYKASMAYITGWVIKKITENNVYMTVTVTVTGDSPFITLEKKHLEILRMTSNQPEPICDSLLVHMTWVYIVYVYLYTYYSRMYRKVKCLDAVNMD